MYYTTYVYSCLLVLVCVAQGQKLGEQCELTQSKTGRCTLLNDCQEAIDDLKIRNKKPKLCGFQGTTPIVCCSVQAGSGQKAKQKCKDYGKYVYTISRPPILTADEVNKTEKNDCGFQVVELIVGGELSKRKEFPHMAAIGYESPDGPIQWKCGGSIISEKYILTAGHCLFSKTFGEAKYVKVGITNLRSKSNAQTLEIIERVKHPDYSPSSHYHDIGLLKLKRNIRLNSYARPACLWTENGINTKKAIASGWGKTSFTGGTSDDLLKVTLDLVDNTRCNYSYRNQIGEKLKFGILPHVQICAGGTEAEKDTCQGDSGGPLQIYHRDRQVKCMYDLIGITSFGKACGIGRSPGIYTKVSNYIQWIENIVWP